MERGAGIIMHISSLPEKYGIGTFGKEAYSFIDFLKDAGITYWQVLPLGHTAYGDSPYQCVSAFAGNPYFIDFDILKEEGLLLEEDYVNECYGESDTTIDYGQIFISRFNVLNRAYRNLKKSNMSQIEREIEVFKRENYFWVDEYALFMALKKNYNYVSWQEWDEKIKHRDNDEIRKIKTKLEGDIGYWVFIQYLFFKQWKNLKNYANKLGIKIIGDIPIYVSADSVDTWSNPENFKVDNKTLEPLVVAGCPPDAFSEEGQLWGNLIYDWNRIEKEGFKWWIERIRESLSLYDLVRIDHFRGFQSYWEIPFGQETAVNGKWVNAPGKKLFNEVKNKLGEVNIIAEDLGYLTDEVREFLKYTGFPGMKVLQFAFDGNGNNEYLPHRYIRKCIAYTGTHDNDTFEGWYKKTGNKNDTYNATKYLGLNKEEGRNWGFIRGIWSSVAYISIAPMQDFLGLGNETRINFPSTIHGNWSWRVEKACIKKELALKINEFTRRYGRI